MDITLAKIHGVFVYIDDILFVTKAIKNEHLNKMRDVMKILDAAKLQLKAEKCIIAQESIEWLRNILTQTGIFHITTKAQGISDRLRQTNPNQLRSIIGAVIRFNKCIPNLAAKVFRLELFRKKNR